MKASNQSKAQAEAEKAAKEPELKPDVKPEANPAATPPGKRGPKFVIGPEVFERVFARIRTGEGTIEAVKHEGISLSQFYARLNSNSELQVAHEKARDAKFLVSSGIGSMRSTRKGGRSGIRRMTRCTGRRRCSGGRRSWRPKRRLSRRRRLSGCCARPNRHPKSQ